jgi:hypothetical protein
MKQVWIYRLFDNRLDVGWSLRSGTSCFTWFTTIQLVSFAASRLFSGRRLSRT